MYLGNKYDALDQACPNDDDSRGEAIRDIYVLIHQQRDSYAQDTQCQHVVDAHSDLFGVIQHFHLHLQGVE